MSANSTIITSTAEPRLRSALFPIDNFTARRSFPELR
jgi:hypothetical protein